MEGIFFAENPFPIMSYLRVELYVVYRAKNSINFSTDKLAGGVDYFKNYKISKHTHTFHKSTTRMC